MKFILGCDHAALELKATLRAHLEGRDIEVTDLGVHDTTSVDYPDIAHAVARCVQDEDAMGLLVCGTGQGMAISANRHPGVRAAVVSDVFSARACREHNDANILCLGQRVIGQGLALDLLDAFIETPFAGGRHARRVGKINPSGASHG